MTIRGNLYKCIHSIPLRVHALMLICLCSINKIKCSLKSVYKLTVMSLNYFYVSLYTNHQLYVHNLQYKTCHVDLDSRYQFEDIRRICTRTREYRFIQTIQVHKQKFGRFCTQSIFLTCIIFNRKHAFVCINDLSSLHYSLLPM